MNIELTIRNSNGYDPTVGEKVKIVGIKESDTYRNNSMYYVSSKIIDNLRFSINIEYSKTSFVFEGKYYETGMYRNITPSDNVPSGHVYISDAMEMYCPYYNCVGRSFNISVSNIYYSQNLYLTVSKIYTKKNYKNLLNIDTPYEDIEYLEPIYINTEDYNKLFTKSTYQSSIFVDDEDNLYIVNDKLAEMGYKTLVIKDSIVDDGRTVAIIMQIVSTIFTVGLVVALFFISYFVIKIILKSRSIYFTTIRILGANRCIAKQILDIELFVNATLAYIICVLSIYMVKIGVFDIESIKALLPFIGLKEIIIMYAILIIMSQLISNRFARKIFKNSVMKTMAEEVR